MENNFNKQENLKQSKIVITNQNYTCLCGVNKVFCATEKLVSISIQDETLNIEGDKLHVQKLDVETGNVEIEGKVYSLKWTSGKSTTNLIKKIFS